MLVWSRGFAIKKKNPVIFVLPAMSADALVSPVKLLYVLGGKAEDEQHCA